MKGEKIHIPVAAEEILKKLNSNGFEAYIVGGYVRDAVLGRACGDIDITTNATPDEVIAVFGDHYISKTGLTHGTVGVIYKGESYEITTYRIDGDYKDHRHPEHVSFSKNLMEDLIRRDFTINTLFYGVDEGVGDKCGGLDDLKEKLIRAVGDPVKRFTEDALRIMRGLRFASQLGFEIDESTLKGMMETKHFLRSISVERISVELLKTVKAPFFAESLKRYPDIFSAIFSEILARADIYFSDTEDLIVRGGEYAQNVSDNITSKLAAFLTPFDNVYTVNFPDTESGIMTKKLLMALKCSGKIVNDTYRLVSKHRTYISDSKKSIAGFLRENSSETLFELLKLQRALGEETSIKAPDIEKTEMKAKELLSSGECLIPSELKINGRDIIALGCNDGRQVGSVLEELYRMVIEDKLSNEKEILTKYAFSLINS